MFWGGLVLFFVLFSLVPNMYELSRMNDVHTDRYFELVHNFYTDYNFYLSRIREGREGALTVHEKYTSEPHQGSYIQIMYLLMGKVSAWLNVPWPRSGDTYHVARIVLAATLLFVLAYAVKSVLDKVGWQITAFVLATAAGTWPILVFHAGEWRFGGYMPWWTIMDALQRITFVPHMLAGQALIIFLLLAMSDTKTMRRPGNWLFLGFLAFLLGVVFPPGLIFVGAAYAVFIVIDILFRLPFKKREDLADWAIVRLAGPAIVGLISAPTLLYLSLALRVYPWKRLVDYAVLHPQPFQLTDYILAVGPLLEIGAIGAIWVLWKKEKKLFLFVGWVIAWAVLIIIFGHIPQESPLRFTEMMPQVPLAILSVYLFYDLYTKIRNVSRYIWIILPGFLILLNLAQLYSSWRWMKEFLDQKIIATQPLVPTGSYVMYPLKDFISTMLFIQDHTSRDTVILSETTAGNYMPVYSGNTVYVGHANTVDTEQKEQIVNAFFSGRMGPTKGKEFLTADDLHYIFFGPQEQSDGGLTDLAAAYPFLTEIYHLGLFHVYHW